MAEQVKIWETEKINRNQIKNAPYNPRVISDKAKKKLKANLLKNGLMGGIVWNKRTGNHQRLSIIDSIYKTQNYEIEATVVDFDLETEKKQNIALNNKEMQGDYDLEKLRELMCDMDGIEETGFTETDTLQMFGEGMNYSQEEYQKACEQAEQATEAFRKVAKAGQTSEDNFYTVVVWKEHSHRKQCLERIGIEDNKFVAWNDFINAVRDGVAEGKI